MLSHIGDGISQDFSNKQLLNNYSDYKDIRIIYIIIYKSGSCTIYDGWLCHYLTDVAAENTKAIANFLSTFCEFPWDL